MWRTGLIRLIRAVAVPLVAVVGIPPAPAPVPDRHSGVPGERFVVSSPGSSGCELWFDLYPRRAVSCDAGWAVVAVPISPPRAATLRWRSAGQSGDIPFAILHVDVDAAPDPVTRGEAVTVTFAGDSPKLLITSCRVAATFCRDRPSWRRGVLLPIPADAPEGRELGFTWSFSYQFGDDAGGLTGTSRVWIALPPPSFAVRPMLTTAGPGIPLAVAFTSRTAGVTITACGLAYRGAEARCDRAGTAVLPMPPETPPDTTITVDYELSYTSIRPGEPDNTIHQTFPIRTSAGAIPLLLGAEPTPSLPPPTSAASPAASPSAASASPSPSAASASPSPSAASASPSPSAASDSASSALAFSSSAADRAWWVAAVLFLGGLLTWRVLHRRRPRS